MLNSGLLETCWEYCDSDWVIRNICLVFVLIILQPPQSLKCGCQKRSQFYSIKIKYSSILVSSKAHIRPTARAQQMSPERRERTKVATVLSLERDVGRGEGVWDPVWRRCMGREPKHQIGPLSFCEEVVVHLVTWRREDGLLYNKYVQACVSWKLVKYSPVYYWKRPKLLP